VKVIRHIPKIKSVENVAAGVRSNRLGGCMVIDITLIQIDSHFVETQLRCVSAGAIRTALHA
jgi:hypothetical protein